MKNEEMSQELMEKDALRHKLTENIIYLQNEIRKRDDLLENASDFELIDESDSQASRRPGPLEEAREALRRMIEEKLQAERQSQNLEHHLRRVLEGLYDVRRVLFDQYNSEAGEVPAEAFEGGSDEVVHEVISRIYGMQRGYEAELSELRHRVKMQQMRLDEGESLKFDIELLTDEKAMLQAEADQAFVVKAELEARLAEAQRMQEEAAGRLERQLRQLREGQEKALLELRAEHGQALAQRTAEAERQMAEMQEAFKLQMVPAIKEKYQAKYARLQDELREVRASLSTQLEEEQR